LGKVAGMIFRDLASDVGIERVAEFPEERVDEESTAHADAPVNFPDGEVDVHIRERLFPGDDVLVDAVDQRAIEVEEKCPGR
jgi:hypothetical protein